MTTNETLLQAIKARKSPLESFGCGISTADHYVRTLRECAGSDLCYRYAASRQESFDDILRKASSTLVYRNPEMVTQADSPAEMLVKSVPSISSLGVEFKASSEDGVELPKDTLVVFRHVLTTPRKDRDGDILRSEGAELDPKMLLLWQHVHTLPIGKVIGTVKHDSESVEVVSAIVDMNELCHDAAVMIENDMARFSHGFRAKEWDSIKDDKGNEVGGFDITKYEIMEASVVSIPSNKDAETQEVILSLVENNKLTSAMMKEVGRTIRANKPLQVAGVDMKEEQDGLQEKDVLPDEGQGKAGGKCECQRQKETTPTETSDVPREEKESRLTEVKGYHGIGFMTGSWESVRYCLEKQLYKFMEESEMGCDDIFCYVVGTFDDHVIACCEKYEYGSEEEYNYCKISWTMDGSTPKLQGTPEKVEVVTEAKDLADHKLDRKAEAVGLDSRDFAAGFLATCCKEQRKHMMSVLQSIEAAEERQKQAETFQSYFKG